MVEIFINVEHPNDRINPMTVANGLTEMFDTVDLLAISEHILTYIKNVQNRENAEYIKSMRYGEKRE